MSGRFLRLVMVSCVSVLLLAACGGSGGDDPSPPITPATRSVGGSVHGLDGSLVLNLNASENLNVAGNGNYVFATRLTTGTSYNISIATQPEGQTCSISDGGGVVGSSDITSAQIVCEDLTPALTYSIGGSVRGLKGALTLSLNGRENLSIESNSGYVFVTQLPIGVAYNIAINSQPDRQICSISNASGVIAVATTTSQIVCEDITNPANGTVNGLVGDVVIQVNDSQPARISHDGAFEFAVNEKIGAAYSATILEQPLAQDCVVTNPTGNVGQSGITISITCTTSDRPIISHVWPAYVSSGSEVRISGSNLADADIIYNGVIMSPTQRGAHYVRFIAPVLAGGEYSLVLDNAYGSSTRQIKQISPLQNVVSVSAGGGHSCALLDSGVVKCWGSNRSGQLGNAENANSTIPVVVSGINDAVSVSAGKSHSCAVLASGAVKCWGIDWGGAEDGNRYNRSVPTAIAGIRNAVKVDAGGYHGCALLDNGDVACWGSNHSGQLGAGHTNDVASSVLAIGISNVVGVSSGLYHTCAVQASGLVKCWGDNSWGQLGDGTTLQSAAPVAVVGISNAIAVSSGDNHSCALLASGSVQCWGANVNNQLGDGFFYLQRSIPVTVSQLTNAVAISAGAAGSCALLNTGSVSCWGFSDDLVNSSLPTTVANIVDAQSIDVGSNHACMLSNSKTLKCWGSNANGRLGFGRETGSLSPVTIAGISHATTVEKNCVMDGLHEVLCWGEFNTRFATSLEDINAINISSSGSGCAVDNRSAVKCWGWNTYGGLGDGTIDNHYHDPVAVTGISDAISALTGGQHACALSASGSVRCWGNNAHGQLGNRSNTDSAVPVVVEGINNAVAISAGWEHSCALLRSGQVYCWGGSYGGVLGNGATADSSIPVAVSDIGNAVSLSSDEFNNCAILGNGSIKCWGIMTTKIYPTGWSGTATVHSVPESVPNIFDAVSVKPARDHVCALSRNGVVRCWGDNGWGQLGNGSRIGGVIPVAVSGISNAVAISENCAVFDDGFVQCWGYPDRDDDAPYELPIYFGLLTLPAGFSAPSGVVGY